MRRRDPRHRPGQRVLLGRARLQLRHGDALRGDVVHGVRRLRRCLPDHFFSLPPRRTGDGPAATPLGSSGEPFAGSLRVEHAATDQTRHGEGRGHLPPLRPVRRAVSDGGMGHEEVRAGAPVREQRVGRAGSSRGKRMSGVNDFAFRMATVNGTGSASANSLLMQAIFRMGVPVTGKNLFPSNIQGLPTFYEIRVSKDGYTARPHELDLVVALNPATYAKDVATVR